MCFSFVACFLSAVTPRDDLQKLAIQRFGRVHDSLIGESHPPAFIPRVLKSLRCSLRWDGLGIEKPCKQCDSPSKTTFDLLATTPKSSQGQCLGLVSQGARLHPGLLTWAHAKSWSEVPAFDCRRS